MLLGYLLLIFPAIALLSALLYLPIYLIGRKCGRKHTPAHHIAVYAFIGCCCSLAYLTILWYYPNITFHPEYHFLNLVPFIWLEEILRILDLKSKYGMRLVSFGGTFRQQITEKLSLGLSFYVIFPAHLRGGIRNW